MATKDKREVAKIEQSMHEFKAQMGPLQENSFPSKRQNVHQVFELYKDDNSFTQNEERRNHFVRSTAVKSTIPRQGIRSLVAEMPLTVREKRFPVTIYTLGGEANEGLDKTSFPEANSIIEMEVIAPSGEFTPADHDSLHQYHGSFLANAGWPADAPAYPNYPGNTGQQTNRHPELIQKIRNEFDPDKKAFAPLADGGHGRESSDRCTGISSRDGSSRPKRLNK